jgi:serine/threonine protein kinase
MNTESQRTCQSCGNEFSGAMEFVEGETLENLINRSGRLEVNLALEITSQVAAGLAAVHKQKLVHRDIKPSNIMVSLKEECALTAGYTSSADEFLDAALTWFGDNDPRLRRLAANKMSK